MSLGRNGERPTKYFFNLEKRNYNKKTISELRLQDESTTNNENVILDQIEIFYKNLYTSEGNFSDEACMARFSYQNSIY